MEYTNENPFSKEPTIKNAIVDYVTISNGDHGCLSAWVGLDYGGSGQGFGGYALYVCKDTDEWKHKANFAGHFINRVLEVCGVTKWADCKGKAVRVKSSHSKVYAIGHIVKDDWFNPEEDFKGVADV